VPTIAPSRQTPHPASGRAHGYAFEGVLGTSFDLTVIAAGADAAGDAAAADAACDAALAEIARLEAVFSRFAPSSDLNRWLRGETLDPASDLFPLLRAAGRWVQRTDGAFHPGAHALAGLWAVGEAQGELPPHDDLARVVAQVRGTFVHGGATVPDAPPYALALDAIAKGAIVDAALSVVMAAPHVEGALVDLGGDLRAAGACAAAVAVADPYVMADNAPPVGTVLLSERALATSGLQRRGYLIDGRWYPHVIDPRTGRPVEGVASATVIAPTCTDADAFATACCIMEPDSSLDLADALGFGLLLCLADGEGLANHHFLTSTPGGVRDLTEGTIHAER
jgi:FAD:protein FMN transferase